MLTLTETLTVPVDLAELAAAVAKMTAQLGKVGLSTAGVKVAFTERAGYSDFRESSPGTVTLTATVQL